MVERELIELISYELIYFIDDPSKYYPGFRKGTDHYLAVSFDKETGELHSIFSLYNEDNRSDWNYIDKNRLNVLDLQYLYEDLFLCYKGNLNGLSINTLEYLLKEDRISQSYFDSYYNNN